MGAFGPISSWIPEDDLLLKNAVEAGASLESLAKGAVRFSRRFTIRELQDRWLSLLYDPDISAEASAHMVEIELPASNLSLKSNRSGNSNNDECVSGNNSVGSVRNHYYAMRRMFCSEPCNSIYPSFLVAPSVYNCTGNRGGCQGKLTLHDEPESGNCMFEDPISNHLGLQEADLNIVHDDTVAGGVGGTTHTFHTGQPNTFEDDRSDGIMGRDCLYGFVDNVSSVSVKEAEQNGIGPSFEQDNVHNVTSQQNLSVFRNWTGVQEMGTPELFETDDFEAKSNNPGTTCSGFRVCQGFSSSVSDCSAAFCQSGYSSPLARMPIWGTIDNISTLAMQIDESCRDIVQDTGDTTACPDDGDADKISPSCYDVVCSEHKLKERMTADGLTSSTAFSEGDFLDLSSSLLNFADAEDLLFMDVDVKDMMDRSCLDGLDSILLNSPTEVHQDEIPSITEPKASEAPDTFLVIHDDAYLGDSGDIRYQPHFGQVDGHEVCHSESNMSAFTSAPNLHFPELHDGVICCKLNTEDPEIPMNDDVFSATQLPPSFSSPAMQQISGEACNTASSFPEDFWNIQRASELGSSLTTEEVKVLAQGSQMIRSQILSEVDPSLPVDGCGIKSELSQSESLAVLSRHAGTASGDPHHCKPVPVTPNFVLAGELKEVTANDEMGKQHDFDSSIDSFLEKPVHSSDHVKICPRDIVGGCKLETDMPVAIQKHLLSHAEPGSTEMAFTEPVVNLSTSGHEEQHSESDDVPYFSDIEAMILDMDLGPDDQDSYFNREVLKYQFEHAKRAIIRLEEGAKSYMQRAIASHGAYAILYGRHLKQYIKKSEVLLGRATNDVNVDIDLGREGCANKISRRQAVLKMDEDGSFYLKNLGRHSISVNSKEVATGQRLHLSSGCLIEIQGMRFIFETSQSSSRQ